MRRLRRWLGSSIEVDSQTDVYESSWMLRAEWRMRMSRPRALDCIRRNLASTLTRHGDKLVSLRKLWLPCIGPLECRLEPPMHTRSRRSSAAGGSADASMRRAGRTLVFTFPSAGSITASGGVGYDSLTTHWLTSHPA